MTADFEKDFIKWEKRFELGIPVIDAQHKRLVELCTQQVSGDAARVAGSVFRCVEGDR